MADQADFPNIYIDSSVEAGGVGSEADPYSAFSEINWGATGDNSITDYYAGGPAASVTINLKRGETWRERLNTGHGGTVEYRLFIQAYGTGDDPIISGADIISTWSDEGSNIWSASSASEPGALYFDGTEGTRADTLLEVTADQDWYWEAGTLYQHSTSDPDARYTSPGTEASFRWGIYSYEDDYVTIKDIHVTNCGDSYTDQAIFLTGDYVDVDGCTVDWCYASGIKILNGDYGRVFNCDVSYCTAHNISATGTAIDQITGIEFFDNVSYGCRRPGTTPSGYGLKFIWADSCKMYRNEVYACEHDAIDFDGASGVGCDNCEVYENYIHDNLTVAVAHEFYGDNSSFYNNLLVDNKNTNIKVHDGCTNTKIYNNIIYYTTGDGLTASDKPGIYIDGNGQGTEIIGNTIDVGGYYTRCVVVISGASATNMKVKNNIFVGATDTLLSVVCDDYTGFEADYNYYRKTDGDPLVLRFADDTCSVGPTGTFYSLHGFGYNSQNVDPQFTDSSSQDYTLKSTSPCEGGGDPSLGVPYNNGLLSGSVFPSAVLTGDRDDY